MKALLDSKSLFLFLLAWNTVYTGVLAQVTNATCSAEYKWMENARGQSPCLVAAYLSQQCIAGTWTVPAIVDRGPYNPPTGQGVSQCRCSSVVYSLLSACSICQGGRVGTWAEWIGACPGPMVTIGSFPTTIPPGTQIPIWSQLDPTRTDGSFSVNLAKTAYDQSEYKPSGGRSTNWGAIVGSIAGGIAAIALVGVLGWYFLRRRRYKAMLRVQGGGLSTPLDPIKVQKMKPGAYKELDMDPLLPSDSLGTSAPPAGGIRTSYDSPGMVPSTTPSSSHTSFSNASFPSHPPPNYTPAQPYYDPYAPNSAPSRQPSRRSMQYGQSYSGTPLPHGQP